MNSIENKKDEATLDLIDKIGIFKQLIETEKKDNKDWTITQKYVGHLKDNINLIQGERFRALKLINEWAKEYNDSPSWRKYVNELKELVKGELNGK